MTQRENWTVMLNSETAPILLLSLCFFSSLPLFSSSLFRLLFPLPTLFSSPLLPSLFLFSFFCAPSSCFFFPRTLLSFVLLSHPSLPVFLFFSSFYLSCSSLSLYFQLPSPLISLRFSFPSLPSSLLLSFASDTFSRPSSLFSFPCPPSFLFLSSHHSFHLTVRVFSPYPLSCCKHMGLHNECWGSE